MITGYLKWLGESQYENYIKNLMRGVESMHSGDEVASFIDIGCGIGDNTIKIAASLRAQNISGIELDYDAIREARGRNINVIPQSLEDERWDIADNSFDFVYTNQVIEHLYSVDNFLGNIKRILKNGGHALISTENLSSWHNVFALFLGYQPFSSTNICTKKWSIGNPLSVNSHAFSNPLLIHRALFTHYALREFYYFMILKLLNLLTPHIIHSPIR
jgi:2-polyprenyl-3-methyl-5-hydroxy-6-metoxy-1,4-benzoquinol methylase